MPELPDITVYVAALEKRLLGQDLRGVRIVGPFLLRTVEPPAEAAVGRRVTGVSRLGKRIIIAFDDDLYYVLHLMIAGRLRWTAPGAKPPAKIGLAVFDFAAGAVVLTEAGAKRRTSLHVVAGAAALEAHDPGGIDILAASPAVFAAGLRRESHTLKRALTDQRLFDGVGNAYSDEILHRARLSPFRLTGSLSDGEAERLRRAAVAVLTEWTARLAAEAGDDFPRRVTAFRKGMAVHGRYGQPCPECGRPVQRVRYADREMNYCAACQLGGRLLADRALSRLLKADWPRTLDELEALHRRR